MTPTTYRDLVDEIARYRTFQAFLKVHGLLPLLQYFTIEQITRAAFEVKECDETTYYRRQWQLRALVCERRS